jgi:hypothetical protein
VGFLDELKDKAEVIGEKAKDGFVAAKEKASELIEDVKDRIGGDDDEDTLSESATHADFAAATGDSAADSEDAADTSSAADDSNVEDAYDEVLDAAQDRKQANETDPPIS